MKIFALEESRLENYMDGKSINVTLYQTKELLEFALNERLETLKKEFNVSDFKSVYMKPNRIAYSLARDGLQTAIVYFKHYEQNIYVNEKEIVDEQENIRNKVLVEEIIK